MLWLILLQRLSNISVSASRYLRVDWIWTTGRGPGGLPSDDLSRFGFGGCIGNRCAVWKPQSDGLGASAVDALPRLLRVILIWGFFNCDQWGFIHQFVTRLWPCLENRSLKWIDFLQCVHCVVLFSFFGWRWFRMLSYFVSAFCCRDDFAIFGVWSHPPFS